MPLNIPNLLTWARILLIPLVVGVYYLPLPGPSRISSPRRRFWWRR
jgi:phosphatidylglycerophosphate synthase